MDLILERDVMGKAAYDFVLDRIYMPSIDEFFSMESYHGTLLHEMSHASRHPKRLGRIVEGDMYSFDYAKEELVAELTSALLGISIGMNVDNLQENNKGYIQHWIEGFQNKPEIFWIALREAVKAEQYLLNEMEFSVDFEKLSKNIKPYQGEHELYWKDIQKYGLTKHAPVFFVRDSEIDILAKDNAYTFADAAERYSQRKDEFVTHEKALNFILFYPRNGEIRSEMGYLNKDGSQTLLEAVGNSLQGDHTELLEYLGRHAQLDAREAQNKVWIENTESELISKKNNEALKARLNYLKAVDNYIERARVEINYGRDLPEAPKIDRYSTGKSKSNNLYSNKNASLDSIKANIAITEYAIAKGYTLKRDSKTIYSLTQHDSCKIYTDRNDFYRFSNGKGGTILDFIMEFENCELKDAIAKAKEFATEYGIDLTTPIDRGTAIDRPKKESLSFKDDFPPISESNGAITNYLVKERGINTQVVQKYINENLLYEDTRHNCVFVNCDENAYPNYGFIRGTHGDYKQEISCEKSYGIHVKNDSNVLVITEGVIDAMSHQSLFGHKTKYDYLVVGGTQKGISRFESFVKAGKFENTEKVVVAFDNDEAGTNGSIDLVKHIQEAFPQLKVCVHTPVAKDFNDDLVHQKGVLLGKKLEKMGPTFSMDI